MPCFLSGRYLRGDSDFRYYQADRMNLGRNALEASSQFAGLGQKTQLIMSSLPEYRTRDDVMNAQLQFNLASILELVRRIDTVNAEEHPKIRAMIVNTRYPGPRQHSDAVAVIANEVELLSVPDDQEPKLRAIIQQNH